MDKFHMVLSGTLAIAIFLQVTTAQKVLVVGANIGWTMPLNGAVAYETWASENTFNVGDTLVFNFVTGRHDVQEVSENSFEECNTKNVIGKSIKTGPTNVTLESSGDHYYICTVGQHCVAGQKLAITVSGAGARTSDTLAENASPPSSSSTVMSTSFMLILSSIALAIFL